MRFGHAPSDVGGLGTQNPSQKTLGSIAKRDLARFSAKDGGPQKTFVNACKTWFWRRGAFSLMQAPPKSQKSAIRHTFISKKCVKMMKNQPFCTFARREQTSKTFVNACKTWFWRRGAFSLKQAPPESQKSAF